MKDETAVLVFFAIGAALGFLLFGKERKVKKVEAKKIFTPQDAEAALLRVEREYGKETAQLLERILRLETAHFKSKQFQLTGSAGMEAGKWAGLPASVETITLVDNQTKQPRPFIVWDSVYSFLEYLIAYARRHGDNWARWNTTNPEGQTAYKKKVNAIKNRTIV